MSKEHILTLEIAEQFLEDPDSISLDEYTSIQDAAAESLSKHQGELYLSGLTQLSDAAAESLSKCQCQYLMLGGLEELSDAAAESLSKCHGDLNFEYLPKLSDAAAESLSNHKGELGLTSLTELSDAAAQSFATNKYRWIDYDCEIKNTLYLEDKKALDKFESLLYIKSEILNHDISLGGFGGIDKDAAEILASHEAHIDLSGLRSELVSDEIVQILSTFHSVDLSSTIKSRVLALNGPITLDLVEKYLKEQDSEYLELSEHVHIEDDAAESLSKHNAKLYLNGLTELSDAAAESLSSHKGNLDLLGLQELTTTAAQYLVQHRGPISVPDELLAENEELHRILAWHQSITASPLDISKEASEVLHAIEIEEEGATDYLEFVADYAYEIARQKYDFDLPYNHVFNDTLEFIQSAFGQPICKVEGAYLAADGFDPEFPSLEDKFNSFVYRHTWYFVGTKPEVLERLRNGPDD
jgi:hypothetical protein